MTEQNGPRNYALEWERTGHYRLPVGSSERMDALVDFIADVPVDEQREALYHLEACSHIKYDERWVIKARVWERRQK